MKISTKFIIAFALIFLIFATYSCLFRKKEPALPVDQTEREIVIYNMNDSEDVFDKLIADYKSKNPYTNVVYRKFDDFAEYEKLILDELSQGEGPDIFAMPNSWFVKNRKKLVAMPANQGTPQDFRNLFVDVAAKDLIITDNNGIEQVYGVPLYVDTLALYYNKDQFEDRIPSRGKPSLTWDGIKNDVLVLPGIAMGTPYNVTNSVDALYSLMMQYGTQFYDNILSKVLFADSVGGAASSALDLYTSFADSTQRHYTWNEDKTKGYFAGDVTAFVKGEISMIFGYSDMYDYILAQRKIAGTKGITVISDDAVKIAPFPQLNDPSDTTKKRSVYAKYFAYGVARTSKNPDKAWEVLTYLTSQPVEKKYFDETNKPTSRRDLIAQEKLDPMFGVFAEQTGYAESFPIVDQLLYFDLFKSAIESVNNGQMPRNALKPAQDAIQKLLPIKGIVVPLNEEYYKNLKK